MYIYVFKNELSERRVIGPQYGKNELWSGGELSGNTHKNNISCYSSMTPPGNGPNLSAIRLIILATNKVINRTNKCQKHLNDFWTILDIIHYNEKLIFDKIFVKMTFPVVLKDL